MEFINPKKRKKFEQKSGSFLDDQEIPTRGSYLDDLREQVKQRSREDLINNRNHPANENDANQPLDANQRVNINIKVSLPKAEFDWLVKAKRFIAVKFAQIRKYRPSRKHLLIAASCLVAVAIIFVAQVSISKIKNDRKKQQLASQAANVQVNNSPKFSVITPKGGAITKDKIFYDPMRNYAKYDDQIDSAKVNVSQQPIPDNFKTDPNGNLKKMAENFGSKELLSSEEPVTYIGQNTNGQQTVIFIKGGLLVFIVTNKLVEKTSIRNYIQNLN